MNLTPEEQRCPTFPVQGGDFGVKTHTISGYGSSSNKNRKYFSCALGKQGLMHVPQVFYP
ncbi:hypothetical protein DPMN_158593 [Dreissena polymorpha]|uniref:Uncharacterized protein n=1 Tax=Dreissena polymorpha TaxID=45954 RepID=A0A9D4IM46_DREPO|nr:hypothetical protein DPMN_158593 [Dreissena polymorpha]